MKKVSVIVPVYNTKKYVKDCLDSIINQTYKNLEIIVINDKSTDSSMKIVKKYKDKRIKIINLKKNSGVAIARNTGIDLSTGDYICFLDSDDFWNLKKIEIQVKLMNDNNYEFLYGDYEYLKPNGKRHRVVVPKTITYKEALKNTTIFTSTVMFNMKKLSKEDIYMPNLRRGQDTACWWQVLKKGITAHGINEVLSVYRVGNKSISSNKFTAIIRTWKIYKRENIFIIKRLFYFSCYIYNAIRRRI